ncbi:FAD-dependent oxidoreductase [Haloglomus salinum]|uniref:FAD-dependent oxidoreductase n=1 Tax=Haloglomus salinum TaxID=2962673 RepID=UPI0020C9674A|nr:hypothetical protein [Haloglomus salinum]
MDAGTTDTKVLSDTPSWNDSNQGGNGDARPGMCRSDGGRNERQVLVVGHGLGALATVGFLEHAGLSPVLAPGDIDRPDHRAVIIWRTGLELLERIGLRRPVEAESTPLNDLRCLDPPHTWSVDPSPRPSLVAIRRDRLADCFERQLESRIRTVDHAVRSTTSTGRRIRVSFENGVTEGFDTVVTGDRAVYPETGGETSVSVIHQWAFDWPSGVPAPNVPTEAWGSRAVAFAVPVGDTVRAGLSAADGISPTAPTVIDRLHERFTSFAGAFGEAISALDEGAIGYRRIPYQIPVSLSRDGIVLVGPAAAASLPGDSLGPALSIEDGWVLADALRYGPTSLEAALSEYERRRRWRLATIESSMDDEAVVARVGDTPSGMTYQFAVRRTAAFSHVLNIDSDQFTPEVPDGL